MHCTSYSLLFFVCLIFFFHSNYFTYVLKMETELLKKKWEMPHLLKALNLSETYKRTGIAVPRSDIPSA